MELEDCMKGMDGFLSLSQEKLLHFVLEHKEQAAVMTVQELADACQVSIATASRFVKQLGFGSYGQFQGVLQRDLLKRIDTVQKIRNTAAAGDQGGFIHSALARDRTTMELEEAGLKEETVGLAVFLNVICCPIQSAYFNHTERGSFVSAKTVFV